MADSAEPKTRREARDETELQEPQSGRAMDPEKTAKIEKLVRTIMIFVMPLIMIGMMITGYLGTMHSPQPNGMPIVVSGSATLADAIAEAQPDGLDVEVAASAYDARQRVVTRDATAAIVVDGDTATLYTASAGGARTGSTVASLVTPLVTDAGLRIQADDVAPLPANDPTGMGAMFLATALVMAGYMPFSVLRSNSPELLTFRRAVPLIAGWAAIIAGLVWVVTGPILGVVALKHSLAVLGIAWLGVFAIASVQLFITRLFGSMGVIFGMLFLMVLGMPSSNMALSVYTMPTFYQFLHRILPMPAIGESMRAVLYFDGVGVAGHLLVLAAGAVVGLLATKIFDLVQQRRKPDAGPLSVNIPSLHGGRRPDSRFWRYLSIFVFPFTMVAMMITFMLGAMHAPAPHDMPVAVVGTAEQADETVAGLDEQLGDMLDLRTVSDPDEARELVMDREIVAAFELPTGDNPTFTLVANEAGNMAAYQVVSQVFGQVAAAQEMPLDIVDVQSLPENDSNGVVVMYVAMGWIMAGFMLIIVGANAAPHTRPLKKILPLTVLYAPFMSLVVALIAGPVTGAVEGHFAALWGAGSIAIACIAMFAMIFERLIGMFAIIPVIGTLMFAGVPASNAALSEYMAPSFFGVLHDILPMPAAAEAIRSILYFDGDVVGHHLQVLAIWGLVSLAVVFVIDQIKPVRTEHDFGDMDPALLPGANRRPQAVSADPATATGGSVDQVREPALV